MTVRSVGDGFDPTAMEEEDGLCHSTRIKGQSICPARIRQTSPKKTMQRLFFLPAMQRRPLPGMPWPVAMSLRHEIRSEYSDRGFDGKLKAEGGAGTQGADNIYGAIV